MGTSEESRSSAGTIGDSPSVRRNSPLQARPNTQHPVPASPSHLQQQQQNGHGQQALAGNCDGHMLSSTKRPKRT